MGPKVALDPGRMGRHLWSHIGGSSVSSLRVLLVGIGWKDGPVSRSGFEINSRLYRLDRCL